MAARFRERILHPPPKKPLLRSLPLRAMPPGSSRHKDVPQMTLQPIIDHPGSSVVGSPTGTFATLKAFHGTHVPLTRAPSTSREREIEEFRQKWRARSYEPTKRIPRFGENMLGRIRVPSESRQFKKSKRGADSGTDSSSQDGHPLDPWTHTREFVKFHQKELKANYDPNKRRRRVPAPYKPPDPPLPSVQIVDRIYNQFAPEFEPNEPHPSGLPEMVKLESKPRVVKKGVILDMPWERPTDLPPLVKTNFTREISKG